MEFKDIRSFCQHLERSIPMARVTMTQALHEAGIVVQDEAKDSIGHYQEAAGPFAAWPELSEATLHGITDLLGHHPGKIELGFAPPDNPLLATGALREHIKLAVSAITAVVGVPDATVGSGQPGDHIRNIGRIAQEQEFGVPDSNIPPRSFLGRALFVRTTEIVALLGHAAALAISGRSLVVARPSRGASHKADEPPF